MGQYDVTKTHKNPGELWIGLPIPAEGAELIISVAGKPTVAAAPLAKLLGLTEKGTITSITKTFTEEFFDEFKQPLERNLDQSGMSLKTRVAQILDPDVLTAALSGVGTKVTVAGKVKYTIGESVVVLTSVAVISPTKNDPTKFLVSHIYAARNVAPFDLEISRQTRAGIDLEFQGEAIPTRVKTDSLGQIWYDVAV